MYEKFYVFLIVLSLSYPSWACEPPDPVGGGHQGSYASTNSFYDTQSDGENDSEESFSLDTSDHKVNETILRESTIVRCLSSHSSSSDGFAYVTESDSDIAEEDSEKRLSPEISYAREKENILRKPDATTEYVCGEDYVGNLPTVPYEITRFQCLTSLKVSHLHLTEFPEAITTLLGLTELCMAHNKIGIIPTTIQGLGNLQLLDFSYNLLKTFPVGLCRISTLKQLYLRHNKLPSLPKNITQLTRLENLILRSNQLRTLPEGFDTLPLVSLDLSNNPFIPEVWQNSLPVTLNALQAVHLGLTKIPESFLQLTNLRKLDLDTNKLTVVSAMIGALGKLEELSLSHNALVALPAQLCSIKPLVSLKYMGNSLQVIGQDIVNSILEGAIKSLNECELPEFDEEMRITTVVLEMLRGRGCQLVSGEYSSGTMGLMKEDLK